MKSSKTTKIALTIVATLFAFASFAQNSKPDYEGDPKANERVIGTVITEFNKSSKYTYEMPTSAECYSTLLEKAKKEYPNKNIDLRNLMHSCRSLDCFEVGYDLVFDKDKKGNTIYPGRKTKAC